MATGSPAGSLPGDIDGDGDVDMADVTAGLAALNAGKLSFEEAVTVPLANFGRVAPAAPPRTWCVPLQPAINGEQLYAEWDDRGEINLFNLKRDDEPYIVCEPNSGESPYPAWDQKRMKPANGPGVILRGWTLGATSLGLVSKVLPPPGSDPARRWLLLDDCRIEGDGVSTVQVAQVNGNGSWGGGVWFRRTTFKRVKACCPGARAFFNVRAEELVSDFAQNVPAIYGAVVTGIRKPVGSDFHPDLVQHSWPAGSGPGGDGPGPVLIHDVTARNVHAQGIFLRSAVKLPAVCVSKVRIHLAADSDYLSHAMRELGHVAVNDVLIRYDEEEVEALILETERLAAAASDPAAEAKLLRRARALRARSLISPIRIRQDPRYGVEAGVPATTLDGLSVIDADVVKDDAIVVG